MHERMAVFRNILVLAALVGMVLFSWLLGHTLRYSIPALWHPPIRETNPNIKTGMELEFEGIRREVVIREMAGGKPAQAESFFPDLPLVMSGECQVHTFFTSLPAKCLTPDGRLVKVTGTEPNAVLISPVK